MFLKDNKYKDVIIAALITFTFCIIIYKAFDILGPGITYFFKEFVSLSMPFVYGIVIAYILSPVVRIFERRLKLSNGISIALTYAVFLGIIFVLCIYGIPSLIDSIKDIASNADSYMESVRSFIDKITNNPMLKDFASTTGVVANLETYISKVGTIAVNLLESSLSGIFSVSSQIVKVILGFIVSIYVLIDKNRLIAASKKFLELFIKKEKTEKIIEFMKIYNDMIGAYIGIKALDSLIIGIMAFILLSIVNSEYAVLLSIIVGCTNMIPYFGPFVGEIVGFLINLFVSPIKAVIVFVVLFSLQMFDGWYLDSKLVGNKVGVRPFWIIYAVVIGGGFFGVAGMLLGSPTAAVINIYYKRIVGKKLSKKKAEK